MGVPDGWSPGPTIKFGGPTGSGLQAGSFAPCVGDFAAIQTHGVVDTLLRPTRQNVADLFNISAKSPVLFDISPLAPVGVTRGNVPSQVPLAGA